MSFDSPNSMLKDISSKGVVSGLIIVVSVLCLILTFMNKHLQFIAATLAGVVIFFFSFLVFNNSNAAGALGPDYVLRISAGIGPFVIFFGCVLNVISFGIKGPAADTSGKASLLKED